MKIKISDIKVDHAIDSTKRFRSDFGDIQVLCDSLKKHGLIHPIVVDTLEDDEKHKYYLVAGERRLIAASYIGWTEIDASIRSDMTDLERKEIELAENAVRKDISWPEQCEALRQLHDLKQEIHGKRAPGDESKEGWVITDTADLVGASRGTVAQDIKLARDLIERPDLKKQVIGMQKFAARKFIERTRNAEKLQDRIKRKNIKLEAELIFGKCEDMIKQVADESVACLITDPPWGVDAILDVANSGLVSSDYNQGTNVGTPEAMVSCYEKLFPELKRVMMPGAHFYMFYAPEWYEPLKDLFFKHGFLVDPVPLIWAKHRTTMIPNPYHYIPSYEAILFGCRMPRNRTLARPQANCLTKIPADAGQTRIHPLQKPRDLIALFIENSTVPGELVMDCFAGSAIVIKTAKELARRAIGFECDQKNFYAAQKFLKEKSNEPEAIRQENDQ